MARAEEGVVENGDARSRLVLAALRLFAEKGYEGATTREICERAGANVSAIRYYFGDKAGLYRAAFTEPMGDKPCHVSIDAYDGLPLPAALNRMFRDFLEPLKRGEELRWVMKLHFREMAEPTGVWREEIDTGIKPQHDALVSALKRHLELSRVDADIHRLAFAIIGMAVHFYVGQEVVSAIAPQLLATPKAVDALADRLAAYAVSMIEGEAEHRRLSAQQSPLPGS
ncbi:CerR family C-terminal domain-containing protein [Methylococcus sp. EFPC2]|uniref:CerR family C-terminal domain-containing protein n=1 Tax=Methylococcus sp. EFPC2 TaxID=2812648 RepID=UPI0019673F76|nr:CerR family C-terminal domain-containing protein [Methylococcus sp. EFPC2]QSA95824.1 CerR family C-terminal domain-containing protein [Methylococcus sp. EFPC2]